MMDGLKIIESLRHRIALIQVQRVDKLRKLDDALARALEAKEDEEVALEIQRLSSVEIAALRQELRDLQALEDQYTRDLNDFARIMSNTQEPVDEPGVEDEGEEDESEGVEDDDGGGEEVEEPSPDVPEEGDE